MIADRLRLIQAVSGGGGGGGATDVYYAYRSLILNMQGTAGTATFTDDSPNPLTITPNGNAELVSDATFGTVASFDGSGDYLQASSPLLSSADWTVECWYYHIGGTGFRAIFSTRTSLDGGGNNAVWIGVSSLNKFYFDGSQSGSLNVNGTTTLITGNWYHLAVVRLAGTVTLYVNGVSEGTRVDTNAKTTTDLWIGGQFDRYFVTGGVGPTRISRWAEHTSNFTPTFDLYPALQGTPAQDPYIASTSLILNMQGTAGGTTFVDDSPNALAVTPYGNATLVSDATFGTVASFDGSGDYLTVANNAAFNFGSGDFTVEFWYYYIGLPQAAARIFQTRNGDVYAGLSITHKYTNRGVGLAIGGSLNGSTWAFNTGETGAFSVVANAWTHVAVVRIGSSVYCYINGIQYVISTTLSGSLYWNSADTPVIGGQTSPSRSINARIGPLRIAKKAYHTANFTPPTGLFPTS